MSVDGFLGKFYFGSLLVYLCRKFFQKKGHRPDKFKKYLSVGNSEILYSLQPTPASVEAQNIYQKIGILSKLIPEQTNFLFLRPFFWADRQHCPMSENNITKMNGIFFW